MKSSLNSSIKGGFISFSLKWSSSYSAENSSKTGVIRTVEAALINLPDYWGIDQEFPIMPITHLDKKPTRSASLWDITCDSDGEIPFDMKKPLYLHDVNLNEEDYFLGFFNVGAYQDTLGMKHNLFSHPTEVNVVFKDGKVVLEKILESQKIIDILEDIDYDTNEIKSILKGRLQEDIYKDLEKYLNENSYLKTIWSYYE